MVWLGKDSCRSTAQNKNNNSPTDQRSYISHLKILTITHSSRVFVSKSYKGEMGNGVRENPKISLESPQNFPTFGVEFEFRSAP